MGALRMFLLEYGREVVPKSMSVLGASDDLISVPVVGIVVETTDGWVVLETGFSRASLDDEAACRAIYAPDGCGYDYVPPEGLAGEPFTAALAGIGLSPEDVTLAAVSHLHIDHSGGLPLLADAGVPVVIQDRELTFGLDRAGIPEAYYRGDYADRGVDWQIVDGDAEIAPGISVLLTPGHTPGHMSYRVELPQSGSWIFAMDAADLGQNLMDCVPPGAYADPEDAERAISSLRRLRDVATASDARLVPCHDPWFWRALRHPEGGHR